MPGITRSLLHAAHALGDDALAEAARTDLARLGTPNAVWDAEGPTLCHGYAGVLRCATGVDRDVAERATTGLAHSLDRYRPSS